MKKNVVELAVLAGCVGCKKECKWRGGTAPKTAVETNTMAYNCNSSKMKEGEF